MLIPKRGLSEIWASDDLCCLTVSFSSLNFESVFVNSLSIINELFRCRSWDLFVLYLYFLSDSGGWSQISENLLKEKSVIKVELSLIELPRFKLTDSLGLKFRSTSTPKVFKLRMISYDWPIKLYFYSTKCIFRTTLVTLSLNLICYLFLIRIL